MKTILLLVALLVIVPAIAQTGAPQKINYQAVARDSKGKTIDNQTISIQAEILDSNQSTVLYAETNKVTTNQFGLFALQVGGGSVTSGSFSSINWGSGNKFLRIAVDINGGSNYKLLGVSQFLSVPFALYAQNIVNSGGKQILILSDTITDAQAKAKIAKELGPNTQEIRIVGCTRLTSADLTGITESAAITIIDNPQLQTVNLGKLVVCAGDFIIRQCPKLTNLYVTSLAYISPVNRTVIMGSYPGGKSSVLAGMEINNTGLTGLNFSSLKRIAGDFLIVDNPLQSLNFPQLQEFYSGIISNTKATTLTFPALKTISQVQISNNQKLTAVSFPVITSINGNTIYDGSTRISDNPNLTSINLGTLSTYKNLYFVAQFNKLPSSQVNYLLHLFLSLTTPLKAQFYSDQQNPPAPPTGQGIQDKMLLRYKTGSSVLTD